MSKIIAGTVSAVAVIAAVTACGGGSSGPPNAKTILQSDGYTYNASETSADEPHIVQQAGAGTPSSFAVGENGSGGQIVMVFGSATAAATAANGSWSDTQATGGSLTASQNGDVVTLTGTQG
jgi:hypothetical protein